MLVLALLNFYSFAYSVNVMDFCMSSRILEVYKKKILSDFRSQIIGFPLFDKREYSYFKGAFKIDFTVVEPVVDRITVNDDETGLYFSSPNLIMLDVKSLSSYIKFNWKYASMITRDLGQGYMDIYDSTFSAKIAMVALSNGTLQLQASDASYVINKFDMKIYGGQEANSLIMVLNLFTGVIKQSIQNLVATYFNDLLIEEVNKNLRSYSLLAPVTENFWFNYGLNGNPIANLNSIQMNIKGAFVDPKYNFIPSNLDGQITVPDFKSTSTPVQIYTSAFTLNTLTNVMFNQSYFAKIIDSENSHLDISTTTLNFILPGIEDAFTADQPCAIICNAITYPRSVINAPNFAFTSGWINSLFRAECNVKVTSVDQLAISLDVQLEANSTLQLSNWVLSGNMALLTVTDIMVAKSNIPGGTVNTQGMEDFLNLLANLTLPFFNQRVLNPGFNLPKVSGIDLEDSEINLYNQYFSILSNPIFTN